MAEDWVAYFDETSGQDYFFNAQTGDTSWADPRLALVETQLVFDDLDEPPTSEWQEYYDESAGARYWYNTHTHEAVRRLASNPRWGAVVVPKRRRSSPSP